MDWITDRLPTETDGDAKGEVIALTIGGKRWYKNPWDRIEPGQPWLPFIPPYAPTNQRRRIISIIRTVWMDQGGSQSHTIDAVADDGTAWWMVPGEVEWSQLPALPDREVG